MKYQWKWYFLLVLGLVLTPAQWGTANNASQNSGKVLPIAVGAPSGGETQYFAKAPHPNNRSAGEVLQFPLAGILMP